MWQRLLDRVLTRFVRAGALHVTWPDGTTGLYGDGGDPVRVTVSDPALVRRLILTPDLAAGEGYMDGTLTVANDNLAGFVALAMRNRIDDGDPVIMRLGRTLSGPPQRFLHRNGLTRSRLNVAHHYDLSSDLYDLFLDADRQYSCAYFARPDMTLEQAQVAKKAHIAAKLRLAPDMRVLDIGCGWGGMALTLARDHGARVVGVTLSAEQHRMARDRVAEAGLSDRIDIRLMDYRDVTGPFDRIVSVGMFEHVGRPNYAQYFNRVRDLLTPDGIALIHTIGTQSPPRATSAWIRRYIFPGGYLPALSEIVSTVEHAHLTLTDVEILRDHYAQTLRHWHARFAARIDEARALYDDRFCRMWRFYLTASELAFVLDHLAVFQIQIARGRDAVPITRDYIYD